MFGLYLHLLHKSQSSQKAFVLREKVKERGILLSIFDFFLFFSQLPLILNFPGIFQTLKEERKGHLERGFWAFLQVVHFETQVVCIHREYYHLLHSKTIDSWAKRRRLWSKQFPLRAEFMGFWPLLMLYEIRDLCKNQFTLHIYFIRKRKLQILWRA